MRNQKTMPWTRQRNKEETAQKVAVLLHEHTVLRSEILAFVGYYMNHVRNFQLMLIGLCGAVAFIAGNWRTLEPSSPSIWYLWFVGITLVPIAAGYLAFDIIYAAYVMALLGARNGCIERQIALMVGPNLMIWETQIANLFYKERKPAGVRNPAYVQGVFVALLGGFVIVFAPLAGYGVLCMQPTAVPGKYWYLAFGTFISVAVFVVSALHAKSSILDTRRTVETFVENLVFGKTTAQT